MFNIKPLLLIMTTALAFSNSSSLALASEKDNSLAPQTVKDLRYGESLFNFFQSKYFSAITNLMIAEKKNPITTQGNDPELLKGGLFLAYGLHNNAHDVFTKLINGNLPASTRDRAFYYLGKSFYKKSYYDKAVSTLTSVTDTLPSSFNDERLHLLSNIYIRRKQHGKAISLLDQYSDHHKWGYYARYNIGVSFMRERKYYEGIKQLINISEYNAKTEEMNSLVDKANLAIGFAFIRKNEPERAPDYLRKVRLRGPLSNTALLGIGWAYSSRDQHKNALRPWLALQKRDSVNTAVQESMLAIPYTFEQLNSNDNALGYYQQAVKVYDQELKSINSVIKIVENGELIASLTKVLSLEKEDNNFKLTTPPVSVATPYIEELIAKHEFQQAYLNYRDLLFLQKILIQWENKLPTYEIMLEERKLRYQSKLPEIKSDTRLGMISALTRQKDEYRNKINKIKEQHDIFAFANTNEKKLIKRLTSAERSIEKLRGQQDISAQMHKFRILKGMVVWSLSRDFTPRLWKAQKQLLLVETGLTETQAAVVSINKVWDTAPKRFAGFNEQIRDKNIRLARLKSKLKHLIGQQQRFLVLMAMRELNNKQRALKNYHARARFSVARLYDKIALPNSHKPNEKADK